MYCVVLDSHVGSEYNDSPLGYEFPSRYLRVVEPLQRGEPIFAVIYEPRGRDGSGKMGYVGWATVSRPPYRTGRTNQAGQQLWMIDYVGGYKDFLSVVPRMLNGRPIESFLDRRTPAQVGNAVRSLPEAEASLIITLGLGTERTPELAYPTFGQTPQLLVADRPRVERLIATIERDARFRQTVMTAYDYRCAVSGFAAEGVRPGRITRLLEAAHVQPVAEHGPDDITNGLALTPTLHKLFDEGLFTLSYDGPTLRVKTSPRLHVSMIRSPDGQFSMPLRDELPVRLPNSAAAAPHADALRFHVRHVFKAG
jgi:putative restriction endonuclease